MNQHLPKRAQRSLMRLAAVMGEGVLDIPVHVFDRRTSPFPAYTTRDGIHISDEVIENEPQNLRVYFGHEILHHVIYDPFVSASFDADVVNVAADYIINHILKAVYGLDVRKVGIVGAYDKRFRNKTLYQAAAMLGKESAEHSSNCCSQRVLTNPIIYRVATSVRESLQHHFRLQHLQLGTVRELVKLTKEQDQALFEELHDRFWRINMRPMPHVDYDLLIRALFGRLYADTVRYDIRKEMTHLGHSHGIALAVQVNKLRKMSRGDPALAFSFATRLADHLSQWGTPRWKSQRIDKIEHRILKLTEKSQARSVYSKAERAKFLKSIDRALIKIEKLDAEKPLSTYLTEENKIRVRPRKEKQQGMAIVEALTIKDDHLPMLKKNDMLVTARRIARALFRELRDSADLRNRLESFITKKHSSDVKSIEETKLKPDEVEEHQREKSERQNVKKIPKKPLILPKTEAEQKAGDEKKNKDGDLNVEADENSEDEQQQREEPDHGHTNQAEDSDQDDEGTADESDESGEPDDEGEDSTDEELDAAEQDDQDSDSQSSAGLESQGEGGGEGPGESIAAQDVRVLKAIQTNDKLLKKILVEADVFREKLAHVSKSNINPDAVIDRTYTFGNEVPKADYSALAKMALKHTRLAFFADVANHALLQNTGTMPKRGSVVIALDCSGSMSGERYVVAAGFAVAMFRIMQDIGRGCALIKFSSNVDGMYVCDVGQPVDMLMLVESLINPSMGGTNFDAPFEQALSIVEELDWKNPQLILVTDGYGEVTPSVMSSVQKKMRTTAVIIQSRTTNIEGIGDTKYIDTIQDLKNGLLQVGRSVC